MTRTLLILLTILAVASAVDYCEVVQPSTNIFLQENETRLLNLNSFVKGYDLSFQSDNPSATIYETFQVGSTQEMGSKNFDNLKSVDMRSGVLSLLAQDDSSSSVGIWVGNFSGFETLPDLSSFKTLDLPDGINANCIDLRSINDKGEAALSCKTVPDSEDDDSEYLLCLIAPEETLLQLDTNCYKNDTLGLQKLAKSQVATIDDQVYVFTAFRDNQYPDDFIGVFKLNDGKFDYSGRIDAYSTPSQKLVIRDFIITKRQEIVMADFYSKRLIYAQYSDGQTTITNIVQMTDIVLAMTYYSQDDSLFVASRDFIYEYSASSPSTVISKYEVDPNQNLLYNIQVNPKYIAYLTFSKQLVIYERKQYKVNYLLKKQSLNDDDVFLLSSHISYLYTFNLTHAQAVSISQPYLTLNDVSSNDSIRITATSLVKTCEVNLQLQIVEDSSEIVHKKEFSAQSYMVDPTLGLSLNLKNYFGGANLEYQAFEDKSKDFDVKVNQIQAFTLKSSFAKPEKSAILSINSNSFYYIGINSIKENMIYADLCEKKLSQITCKEYWKTRVPFQIEGIPVSIIQTKLKANGEPFVFWTYEYTALICFVSLQKKGIGAEIKGGIKGLPISSIKIGDQDFTVIVSKTARYVEVLWQKAVPSVVLYESSFTSQELQQLEQFYPRDAVLDPSNPNVFYVKFPTRIARFTVGEDKKVKFAGIVRDFERYVLDSQWSFTYTGKSMLTIRDKNLKQEYYNPSLKRFQTLQSMSLGDTTFQNFNYDSRTNFASVSLKSNENNANTETKIMIPSEGTIDAEYVQMQLSSSTKLSQNWVLIESSTPQVKYVNSAPTLEVNSHLPDDVFKEDVSVNVKVQNKARSESSNATVEGVNFPVVIKDIPNENVIKLPASASGTEIKLDVGSFFSGPISKYSIDCPFCNNSKIELQTSMELSKNISSVTATVDYTYIGERIVALSGDQLVVMDAAFNILSSTVISFVECRNLVYNKDIGLLLFCSSNTAASGQQIMKYSFSMDKLTFENKYNIASADKINNFDEMFAIYYEDSNYRVVLVLDNDQTIDSNNKYSTIKVFQLLQDSFRFKEEWKSQDFGLENNVPINDMDIQSDLSIYVTLGNYGIGYGKVYQGQLALSQNVQLSNKPEVKTIFLSSSFFKQVEEVGRNQANSQLSLFISSTNSLSMVVSFVVSSHLIYKGITETYYRYGTQRLLNWHAITDQHVYLSYYNQGSQEVTIVEYPRKINSKNQFFQGVTVKLSKNLVKYHQAFVTNDEKLLVSHLTDTPNVGNLLAYNIKGEYYLKLNYDKAGDFKQISVKAENSYHKATHTQKVQFDSGPGPVPPPPPEDDGLKWYVVVIVVAVVLLLVGLAYGMLRYIKKKRSDKNVSLLTEREEGDSEDGPNRGSINDTGEDEINPTIVSKD